MKYFTPELILRAGSPDPAVADAAQDEWDAVGDRYLESVRRSPLPKGARRLLKRLSLHDARIHIVAVRQDRMALSLVLKTTEGEWVGLLYKLVTPATRMNHDELAEPCPLEWLYDEFGSERVDGTLVFTHSILFTDGVELKLTFSDLAVKKFGQVMMSGNAEGLESMQVG